MRLRLCKNILIVVACSLSLIGCSSKQANENMASSKNESNSSTKVVEESQDIEAASISEISAEDKERFTKSETVIFDGVEITLPCQASVLVDMGWSPSKTDLVEKENSRIMQNDKYPDCTFNVMAYVRNFAEESTTFENCVLTSIEVKNTYLDTVLENCPSIEYEGVSFGMSKEDVITKLGEPSNIIESDLVTSELGKFYILEYKGFGLGKSIEIGCYDTVGVSKINVQVIP